MPGGRFSNLEFEGSDDSGQGSADGRSAPPNALRDAQFFLDEARRQEFAAEAEAALRSYSAALGEDATMLDAWIGQLWLLYELGEFPEVDLWARKALEQFPEHPALLAMRSLASLGQGRTREARDFNDAALAKKGESETVWLARADILLSLRATAAEDCFSHARRAAETPDMALLKAARICLRHRRYRLALPLLLELTARIPDAAAAWHLLGLTHWEIGDVRRAFEALAQAQELAPFNPKVNADVKRLTQRGGRIRGLIRRLFRS